jgi:hypothetical protein
MTSSTQLLLPLLFLHFLSLPYPHPLSPSFSHPLIPLFLPLSLTRTESGVKLSRVQVSNDLVHSILAVLHLGDEEETDKDKDKNEDVPQYLLHSNIAGFL